MHNIKLEKLDYSEQHKILDIINNDKCLKETFGGENNTISRILNSNYVAIIKKEKIDIGFIMIVDNNSINEIDIGIISKYQNQGYGTYALSLLKELITKEKINVKIEVKITNIKAIKVVLKNGFVLIEQNEKYNYYSNNKHI